jgi:hypothetical protein
MICTAYKSVSLLIYATIAPSEQDLGIIGCNANHINAPAERPAATDVRLGHVASLPVRLQPVVSGRSSEHVSYSRPLDLPLPKAHLLFETCSAHIDLCSSRWSPYRSDWPFCLSRTPLSLNVADPFQDNPARFNFGHGFLLPVEDARATESDGLGHPPPSLRDLSFRELT